MESWFIHISPVESYDWATETNKQVDISEDTITTAIEHNSEIEMVDSERYDFSEKETKTYNFKDLINFDAKKQIIRIWNKKFHNFAELFTLLRVKPKSKTQFKWWIGIIYSVVKYFQLKWEKESILADDLLVYYKEFKEWIERNNRVFERKGKKWTVSETDCDSAMSILTSCGVLIGLSLIIIKGREERKVRVKMRE